MNNATETQAPSRNAECYVSGCAGYVPDASDDPECVPFYRAWHGLQAAWGRDAVQRHNYVLHSVLGFSDLRLQPAEQYRAIVAGLQRAADAARLPVFQPRYHGMAREPAAPTEADARAEFRAQYRQAFPGQRLNSRHAAAQWLQVKDQATALVQARHAEAMARYREDAARIQARHGADTAQWEAECQRVWDLQALAAELAQEAGL